MVPRSGPLSLRERCLRGYDKEESLSSVETGRCSRDAVCGSQGSSAMCDLILRDEVELDSGERARGEVGDWR